MHSGAAHSRDMRSRRGAPSVASRSRWTAWAGQRSSATSQRATFRCRVGSEDWWSGGDRRNVPVEEEPVVTTDSLSIDLQRKVVLRDGEVVKLTPTEWHLVEVLVRNAGRLVSQRQLLQEVWGPQYGTESAYLRVHMAQVRKKLEPDPSRPRHFVTERGMGYRFTA